jgi:hypothetical protein
VAAVAVGAEVISMVEVAEVPVAIAHQFPVNLPVEVLRQKLLCL